MPPRLESHASDTFSSSDDSSVFVIFRLFFSQQFLSSLSLAYGILFQKLLMQLPVAFLL